MDPRRAGRTTATAEPGKRSSESRSGIPLPAGRAVLDTWQIPLPLGARQVAAGDLARAFLPMRRIDIPHGGGSAERPAPWSEPANIGPVNSTANETRASLARDGQSLYFRSNRPASEVGADGLPSSDIYISTRNN